MSIQVAENGTMNMVLTVGTSVATISTASWPEGHNYFRFTNLTANNFSFTVNGDTPAISAGPVAVGAYIPANTILDGTRDFKYVHSEFDSLKIISNASNGVIVLEIGRVGPTPVFK